LFVNAGQVGKEVPRIVSLAAAKLDDGRQFIARFLAQQLDAHGNSRLHFGLLTDSDDGT
jgi:hypothetical protein